MEEQDPILKTEIFKFLNKTCNIPRMYAKAYTQNFQRQHCMTVQDIKELAPSEEYFEDYEVKKQHQKPILKQLIKYGCEDEEIKVQEQVSSQQLPIIQSQQLYEKIDTMSKSPSLQHSSSVQHPAAQDENQSDEKFEQTKEEIEQEKKYDEEQQKKLEFNQRRVKEEQQLIASKNSNLGYTSSFQSDASLEGRVPNQSQFTLIFLFAQPLVTKFGNNETDIIPVNEMHLDLQGEYSNIYEEMVKSERRYQIDKHFASNKAFKLDFLKNYKIIHIGCHGLCVANQEKCSILLEEFDLIGRRQQFRDYQLQKQLEIGASQSLSNVFIVNACQSELIGKIFQKRFPDAAIFAIEKTDYISDDAAKAFTKYFYRFIFQNWNQDQCTPKKAFEYAIKEMQEDPNIKKDEFKKYKIVKKDAKYLDKPVFSGNEVCDIQLDLSRKEAQEISTLKNEKNHHWIMMIFDDENQNDGENPLNKKLSNHNVMKIYEMAWFMSKYPQPINSNGPSSIRQQLAQQIEEKYELNDKEAANSIGKIEFDDNDQIITISKGNRIRNTQAAYYAAQYAFERLKINFPIYIDLDEAGKINKLEEFLKFFYKQLKFNLLNNQGSKQNLEQLTEYMIHQKGNLIIIIDNFNNIPQDIRQSILQFCYELMDNIKTSALKLQQKYYAKFILIDQSEASSDDNSENKSSAELKIQEEEGPSQSDRHSKKSDGRHSSKDSQDSEEEKHQNNSKGQNKNNSNQRKLAYGYIEYMSFEEAVKKIERKSENPFIEQLRTKLPVFNPLQIYQKIKDQSMFKDATLFFDNYKFLDGLYIGQLSEIPLLPHGYGIFIHTKTGSLYQGWRKRGLRWGPGRQLEETGIAYDGDWEKNFPNGSGRVLYPDNNTFEGTLVASKREGFGVFYDAKEKKTYFGNFENDKKNGIFTVKNESSEITSQTIVEFKDDKQVQETAQYQMLTFYVTYDSEAQKYLGVTLFDKGSNYILGYEIILQIKDQNPKILSVFEIPHKFLPTYHSHLMQINDDSSNIYLMEFIEQKKEISNDVELTNKHYSYFEPKPQQDQEYLFQKTPILSKILLEQIQLYHQINNYIQGQITPIIPYEKDSMNDSPQFGNSTPDNQKTPHSTIEGFIEQTSERIHISDDAKYAVAAPMIIQLQEQNANQIEKIDTKSNLLKVASQSEQQVNNFEVSLQFKDSQEEYHQIVAQKMKKEEKVDIRGEISYQETSKYKETQIDILIEMDYNRFKQTQKEIKEQSYQFIIINRRSGVGKCMEQIKKYTKEYIKKYFDRCLYHNPPQLILFNDEIQTMNENNLEAQLKFIEEKCEPFGKVNFILPFEQIINFIQANPVKELKVLYLTCGGKDDCLLATRQKIEDLKQILIEKNIYSQFNSIELNVQDYEFLEYFAASGTERGYYDFISFQNRTVEKDLSQIEQFFEACFKQVDSQPGITFNLAQNIQAFCSLIKNDGKKVALKGSIYVKNENLKQVLSQIEINQEISFDINKSSEEENDNEIKQVIRKFRELNLDQNVEGIEEQIEFINQSIWQLISASDQQQDEFLNNEIQQLLLIFEQFSQIVRQAKRHSTLDPKNKSILKLRRNEYLLMQNENEYHLKIYSSSNSAKLAEDLVFAALRLKRNQITLKAFSQDAINVLNQTVQKFNQMLQKECQKKKKQLSYSVKEDQSQDLMFVILKLTKIIEKKSYEEEKKEAPQKASQKAKDPFLVDYEKQSNDIIIDDAWKKEKIVSELQKIVKNPVKQVCQIFVCEKESQSQVFENGWAQFNERKKLRFYKQKHNLVVDGEFCGTAQIFFVEKN